MVNPVTQQIIDASADAGTSIYASSAQNVPAATASNVYITNINEYTTIRVSSPGEPAGNNNEVQFNLNGRMGGDDGLTYNPTTDSLDVLGNLTAANVLTNNLLYANGVAWDFSGSGSTYANSNVAAYLPTYTGNLNVTNVVASLFAGSGANLSSIPAGNITGTVANATHAVTAGTANAVAGANVTGTVSLATSATSAASATTAGTVTTAAQPNITSTGSLTGLTVSNATGVVNFTTTANVTLGAVGNLHISGGTSGQILSTNGSGTLSWVEQSSGFDGANVVFISNTTQSTNYNNGALHIEGGTGVGGNLNVLGHIASDSTVYAGHLSAFGSWTAPLFVGRDAGAEFIQGALVNTDPNGSADWVAYGDQSTDSEGWADMGFTGTAFNDNAYTITRENDGYVFVQGMTGAGGNLILATGDLGGPTHRDIIFATGGFAIENEKMRLNHEDSTFYVGAHGEAGGTNVVDLDVNGNIAGGNVSAASFTANYALFNGNGISKSDPAANLNIYSAYGMELTTAGAGMRLEVGPSMFGPGEDMTIVAGNGGDEGAQSSDGGDLILSAGNSGFNAEGQPDPQGGNIRLSAGTGPVLGSVLLESGSNTWTFGAGNLTLPGNTFAVNYANGTQVSLNGTYDNSNVVTLLGSFGSNTISTTGNVSTGNVAVTGTLTSTGKFGYSSGSTVTQTTNRGNGVTINALAGTIITTSVAMVATEIDTFSVLNSSVDPNNDIVLAQIVSPNQGTYNCIANPAIIGGFDNGFVLSIHNISGFTTSDEAITIRFMVIKAPNA